MSLILTSQQSNQPNSLPYDYQNYFSSTMKIAKGSKIALNHVTINRNAFFNFTEQKVFFIYHGVEMPDTELRMRDMPDSTGDKNALLEDTTSVLSVKEINNYVNYPQPVVVPKGEYSVRQLTEKLEYILNNPSTNYGGDFYPAGHWTVKANYNDEKIFQNISFDWDTSTNDIVAAYPPVSSFLTKYDDYDAITYSSSAGTVSTTNTDWNCGEWDRFISNHNGTFRVNIQADNQIAGLTRVTDGEVYQEYGDYVYLSDGLRILDCPVGVDFFDYCVASVGGVFKVYVLEGIVDVDGNSGGLFQMAEYDYGTPVNTYMDSYVEFTVENNNVKIVLYSSGTIGATITNVLKPIGNTTYQLVPKIAIKGKTTVTLGAAPKLLSDTNKPIYPDLVEDGTTDFSDCNISHICNNIWRLGDLDLDETDITDFSETYLLRMFDSIMGYSPINSDDDAQDVQANGQSIAIADMDGSTYEGLFWSYQFDETLNGNDGGFKYPYKPPIVGKEYTFDPEGTVIIHYNLKSSLYHVKGTLDGAIGITPKFRKGEEEDIGGIDKVQILGSNRIALNNNDLLYVRIDLGNGYTMNGATSSVSKIISPILTDTSNAEVGTSLGIRTYTPERMYLNLNNAEDLYINSINVSIVTKGERYAVELSPSTSASFHIISPEKM